MFDCAIEVVVMLTRPIRRRIYCSGEPFQNIPRVIFDASGGVRLDGQGVPCARLQIERCIRMQYTAVEDSRYCVDHNNLPLYFSQIPFSFMIVRQLLIRHRLAIGHSR